MWEIIAANRRRSLFLIAGMGALLLGFGWAAGELLGGPGSGGGALGCGVAGGLWLILTAVSYFQGEAMLLKSSRAREITPEVHPELFNVVEEMKIAASLPAMPKVYVIDDPGLNAFATGVKPEKSAIAVTAGLLTRLDRDELQGVIAHETAHILNRDILYMTLAGVMLGSMQILGQIVTRGMWYGAGSGGSNRRYRSERSEGGSGGGGLQAVLLVVVILFAVLGPILAQLFYFSLSRKREYLADATGARLTRYPEGLALALEKISGRSAVAAANSATAPMFIEKPSGRSASAVSLFATHPPIEKRIAILRSMTSAGYAGYDAAAKSVLGAGAMLPASALKETDSALRGAAVSRPVGLGRLAPSGGASLPAATARQTGDLIRAVNGFIFLTCSCGLRLKLPPEFHHPTVQCPKCSVTHAVPGQAGAASGAAAPAPAMTASAPAGASPAGWRTVACGKCGGAITLSPAFSSPYAVCRHCGGKNPL
jgi:heat shock protein HtpX